MSDLMTNEEKRSFDRQDILILLIIFAAAFIPRLVFELQMLPFLLHKDELATISSITLLYPADWSEILTNLTGYYGGGFTILFTPLFYLFDDPLTIYHCMGTVLCAAQALIVFPAYAIIRKHFHVDNRLIAAFAALCASFTVTRRSYNITNESILYLLTWLIFYVILNLIEDAEDQKRKRIYSVVLALLTAYTISIHERALVFVGMLAVLILFYLYVYHRFLISVPFFAAPFAAGYVCARLLKKAIISANFSAVLREVRNTSVGESLSDVVLLKDPGNWKAFVFSIEGSLTTGTLITGCVLIAGGVIAFCYLLRGVFRPSVMRNAEDPGLREKKFFAGFIFFSSGIAAILLTQSVGWLRKFEAAVEDGWYTNAYALKILTYVRYYGIYLGPIVVLAIVYLYLKRDRAMKVAVAGAAISALLAAFWLRFIYKYVCHSYSAREAWMSFGGVSLYSDRYGFYFYLIGVAILLAFAALMVVMIARKNYRIYVIILTGFVAFQYFNMSNEYDLKKTSSNEKLVKSYYACKQTGISDCFDEIYVVQSTATRYQFLYYDKVVHYDLPDYDLEEGMVIATSFNDFPDAFEHGWKQIEFDVEYNTHLIFVKGDEAVRYLEENGIRYLDKYSKEKVFYPDDFTVISGD